jgi:hypothetical protein
MRTTYLPVVLARRRFLLGLLVVLVGDQLFLSNAHHD